MNNYIRNEVMEESFEVLHGIKPTIYQQRENASKINSKLVYAGKEIILSEVIGRGLTTESTLNYNGTIKTFNRVYDAEVEAVNILRS